MPTPDHVTTEMQLAKLMAQQEAFGFRFDLEAAEQVKEKLACEAENLKKKICSKFPHMAGKVKKPTRTAKIKGQRRIAGAEFSDLTPLNPTSRAHIAFVLAGIGASNEHFQGLGMQLSKFTETGKPKLDEATLEELGDLALQLERPDVKEATDDFTHLLKLQKWLGQLSEGANSWLNMIHPVTGCIHHSCSLATVTGRQAHRGPNLGQVNSQTWARELFKPHLGHKLVGVDLEGLELRCLGHYLSPFDDNAFAEVVVNGDIHQQNADRVGCSRKEVKTLTYAFIYGAGDRKLGHSLHPEYSDAQKQSLGKELRQKFLEAIPGLGPLVEQIKAKVRIHGQIKGLDGRPIFCRSEHSGLNFCLQSAGAIVSKQWCLQSEQLMLKAGLTPGKDYKRCAYVHDEQQISVIPSEAERVKTLLEEAAPLAGEYYNFRVPITASGTIGDSWQETH